MTRRFDPRVNPFDNLPEQDDAAVMAELDELFGYTTPAEPAPSTGLTPAEEDDR